MSGEENNTAANVDAQGNENQENSNANEETQNEFSIPESYKDKPYLKDVSSMDDLYKKLDGAETLLGKKRTVLPDENSSEEEVSEFNKARGVPENVEDYKPINQEDGADNSLFDALRPVFKKANMTQKDVNTFLENAAPIISEMANASVKNAEQMDAEFDTLTTDVFGSNKEKDLAQAKILLAENTPKGMEGFVSDLDNKSLTVLASVLKNVREKYIGEDKESMTDKSDTHSSSADELRKEGQKQISIANDPSKSMAERDAATKSAQDIYNKIENLSK